MAGQGTQTLFIAEGALDRLSALKQRPPDQSYVVLCADVAQARGRVDHRARQGSLGRIAFGDDDRSFCVPRLYDRGQQAGHGSKRAVQRQLAIDFDVDQLAHGEFAVGGEDANRTRCVVEIRAGTGGDDRAKALELTRAQIEKQFGKGSIMLLGENRIVAFATSLDGDTNETEISVNVRDTSCAALEVAASNNGYPSPELSYGSRRPSCSTAVADAENPPGTAPPVSGQCPVFDSQQKISPSR